jgi:hypothetical protein
LQSGRGKRISYVEGNEKNTKKFEILDKIEANQINKRAAF